MLTMLLVQGALAASPAWNLVPFGVGVYLHGRPGRGVTYSVTQAAGIATLAAGEVMRKDAVIAADEDAIGRADVFVTSGVVLALTSWTVALIDAGRLHELETSNAKAAVTAWDAAVARGPEGRR